MGVSTGKPKNRAVEAWENPQESDGRGTPHARDLDWSSDWTTLDVPDGWEPVAKLCKRLNGRRDAVVHAIVKRILEEIPTYRLGRTVAEEDLRASVRSNVDMMLRGTAERRGPRPEELDIRRELGLRRAVQGLPVNALLEAFVVGYREIWDQLVRESRSEDPAARELLLTAAATVWEWVHEVTDAVGTEYHEQIRRRTALTSAMRERLFDALLGGTHDGDEVHNLASSLGFDPKVPFRALATADPSADASNPDGITNQLVSTTGQQHAVKRGDRILVLDQGGDTSVLIPVLQAATAGAAIGIGAPRQGLQGAALSIGDAERALALARSGNRVSHFERDWHAATVLASEHRLADLLKPGVEQARRSPELARTISAFADAGFSMSQAARNLHVHTNTVAYRLARWTELTGWDPRTYDGLLRSTSAITMLERQHERRTI